MVSNLSYESSAYLQTWNPLSVYTRKKWRLMLQDFKQSLLISASCLQDQWLFLSTFPVYGCSPSRGGESGVPTLLPLPLVPVWEREKSWEASLVKFSLLPFAFFIIVYYCACVFFLSFQETLGRRIHGKPSPRPVAVPVYGSYSVPWGFGGSQAFLHPLLIVFLFWRICP